MADREEHPDDGYGLVGGQTATQVAQATLKDTALAAGARLDQWAPAAPHHALGQRQHPAGGERQDQDEPRYPLGTAHATLLPLPAHALEIAKEFLLPGAPPIVTAARGRRG